MIKSFRHKGLEAFYRRGSKAGIQPHHSKRLHAQLTALDAAVCAEDMNFPAWRLHPLAGELSGFWAIIVNGNWRVIFRFIGEDVELVDYLDYHQESKEDDNAQSCTPWRGSQGRLAGWRHDHRSRQTAWRNACRIVTHT